MRAGYRAWTAAIFGSSIIAYIVLPTAALARAGGGMGAAGGPLGLGGLLWPDWFRWLVLPLVVVGLVATALVAIWKNIESRRLLAKLRRADGSWDVDAINSRVERAYFKVQQAWTERDQEIARDYLSPYLFEKHKRRTDEMIEQGRRNVLENIRLRRARIVGVRDRVADSKDRIWVRIDGTMIDYIVDDKTGELVSGSRSQPVRFTELWSFVRSESGWVLDGISQNAGALNLLTLQNSAEGARDGA